jgi:prepilin-type processing-associated H-X9-DG protein
MIPSNLSGGKDYCIKEGVLWPYISILGSYKCKSDASRLLRSYSLSRTMNGKNCNCDQDNINPFRTLGEISRPAERIVFVDADSRERWIDGSFSPVKQIDAVPPEWYCSPNRNITARHSEGFNLSLADGHWEYYRYRDKRTVQLAKWEMGPEEASPDNPDLQQMVEWMRGLGQ